MKTKYRNLKELFSKQHHKLKSNLSKFEDSWECKKDPTPHQKKVYKNNKK